VIRTDQPRFAWYGAGSAALTVSSLLALTINRYGYHRDELYFRMLKPAWGYVDQPPLTPLIARASIAVFGDTIAGFRIPAVMFIAAAILLAAAVTRELGGDGIGQTVSAWAFGFAALPLTTGHLLVTSTVDFALWTAVLWCVARAMLREQSRMWLIAGALVGVSLYNKLLIVVLLLGLAIGFAVAGPRGVFRERYLWAGIALALVIGSPNLIYQATHDFPQVTMAGALSDNNAGEVRAQLIPYQFLLIGPALAAFWIAGLVALLRRPQWRPLRGFAVAYFAALTITFVGGGQIYYAFGLQAFLLAAGAIVVVDWVRRGGVARRAWAGAAMVLHVITGALIALPLVPLGKVGGSPMVALNPTIGDTVGWPQYVRAVAGVYRGLTPQDQAKAVVFTGNYGEAGAIDRFGPDYGLPAAYSAQNELYFQGPPPADKAVVIAWTQNFAETSARFVDCQQRAVLDNGFGVDNEEQGSVIAICKLPAGGWATLWPNLQHYD
jgi:4-amino-4-deoxy-L-arabinose transferase-like glycosyltransferase